MQRRRAHLSCARGWFVVVGALLVGCTLPSPIEPHPQRIRWRDEPTVAGRGADLAAVTREAVRAWGFGRWVDDCVGADVCVARGMLEGRRELGRAEWDRDAPRTCDVWVMQVRFSVVAHELGHCFGLGHSTDRASVMYPQDSAHAARRITRHDRRLLARLIAPRAPRPLRPADGWRFVNLGTEARALASELR